VLQIKYAMDYWLKHSIPLSYALRKVIFPSDIIDVLHLLENVQSYVISRECSQRPGDDDRDVSACVNQRVYVAGL
jgi:hypothetical protein